MKIAQKEASKNIDVSPTCKAIEYPLLDKRIHGAIIILNGRYPEEGQVVNDECVELVYILKGSGKLVVGSNEINFKEGDQLVIEPKDEYYWEAHAEMFVPCAPAWFPEQHRMILDNPE